MWHESDAPDSSEERSSQPAGYFNPYYRQGVQRRMMIALCALPILVAAFLYVAAQFSRWSGIACFIVLMGVALVASREVFSWWYWTYCSHCGHKVDGVWCAGCDRLNPQQLFPTSSGTFDLERYNKSDDSIARLLSLVVTLALRDHAAAICINGLDSETQILSLHDFEWIECQPAPGGLGQRLVSAIHVLVGLPQIQAGKQAGQLTVVDVSNQVHQCHVTTEIGSSISRIELQFDRALAEHSPQEMEIA